MAAVERLMGVGVPAEVAKRVGFFIGTTESGDTLEGPANWLVRASGAILNLSSNFDLGDKVVVFAVVSCSVRPGSGSFINAQATASAAVIEAGATKEFYRFSQNAWFMVTST